MHVASMPLQQSDLEFFRREGYLHIRNLYDVPTEVIPIQRDIYRIIALLIAEHQIPVTQQEFNPVHFDSGLENLVRHHRGLVSVIYDAVKKLPSYVKLACSSKHEQVAQALLQTDFLGFAHRGFGIRMDNANEDKYLTQLHQDYVSQLCSPRGVVFWGPLRAITPEIGPVRVYPGSHLKGILPIVKTAEGSLGLRIEGEAALAAYPHVDAELQVGDVVVLDFLTLHQSQPNRSQVTRWAMISRYFDFNERTGCSHGWKGGLQEGNSFEVVHPELLRDLTASSPKTLPSRNAGFVEQYT